MITQI
jgi:quercetin dioxygenase-like cupin family protein